MRRFRQARKIWLSEGSRGIKLRAQTVMAEWIRPEASIWPVRAADVTAADLTRPALVQNARPEPGEPIIVNWVMPPPCPGSGGHTTIFRVINYLESHGYKSRIYFYDPYRSDHQYYEGVVRNYYDFGGPVADVDAGFEDAHIMVATSWPTAYSVFNARSAGRRFYFVQDFEPSFYPVSTLSILAENTYRMGFHAVTAGPWLAEKLRSEFGMIADHFDFGCDTSRYRRITGNVRNGIAFYARKDGPRRGLELGIMALGIFAERHPDIEIHLYGERVGSLPFKYVDHGLIRPEQLNSIYNRCFAGLSLSLTNVSLVPHEMLAAGCIPVVNDAAHNRAVLNNSFVRYAAPNPQALASALDAVVSELDFEALSRAAAASVTSTTWDEAGACVDAVFRRAVEI